MVFSFANWDLLYGHFPFRRADRESLKDYDGASVSSLGNAGCYITSKGPFPMFDQAATKNIGEDDITTAKLKNDPQKAYQYTMVQRREMMMIPFSFSTPIAIIVRRSMSIYLAMGSLVGQDDEGYFQFGLQTEPYETDVVFSIMNRPMCDGFIKDRDDLMVYYFRPDWLMEQVDKAIEIQSYRNLEKPPRIDLKNADKYYSMLGGYTNKSEYMMCSNKYEIECKKLIDYIRNNSL